LKRVSPEILLRSVFLRYVFCSRDLTAALIGQSSKLFKYVVGRSMITLKPKETVIAPATSFLV
jgi:hypothetical protein